MRRSNRSFLIPLIGCAAAISISTAATLSRASDEAPPRLDASNARVEANSFHAEGFDPAAPRSLVLYRWDGEHFHRVASTASHGLGRFDFGEQPIPSGDAAFHVAVQGEAADPDRLLHIERRLSAPVIVAGGLESREIVLAPGRLEGELWIRDAESGRLLLRKRIDARARYRVSLDIEAELARPWPSALSIEQVLDDGRHSESELWQVDPAD